MADDAQPKPADAVSPPRQYVNFAGAQGGAMELAITLGYREGDAQPTVSSLITVSWEFAPILIRLLQDQLKAYEERVGPVRDIMAMKETGEGSK